ncbi:hypothetical protein D3H35_01335 [Cohnella faecalis]|uniref:Uncharacterized protein n=2 Tax=Cohnella faecalis TaxID=2315694 RepID=A0A398CRS4_9BACL|nr:hypothetical protein D3H35_01335 [Cohnella faecalis]
MGRRCSVFQLRLPRPDGVAVSRTPTRNGLNSSSEASYAPPSWHAVLRDRLQQLIVCHVGGQRLADAEMERLSKLDIRQAQAEMEWMAENLKFTVHLAI